MATHTGIEGTVKIGANAIAEVRTFSIKQSAETIEDTTITDTAKTFIAGQTSWSADISVPTNGMIEASFAAQGSGALTRTAV